MLILSQKKDDFDKNNVNSIIIIDIILNSNFNRVNAMMQ